MTIDAARLAAELEHLATLSADPAPAVTRLVFSPEDLSARAWLKGRACEAGLEVREDAVGNTFFRWSGSDPALPAVATGSHIDAIPHSGRFDGTVGVLGGLEAIRALQASGFTPRRSIELILFTSEEPTRFGIGCLGSRLMSGTLGAEADRWRELTTDAPDAEPRTLLEVRTAAGFAGELAGVRLAEGHYSAFVELHIEQGPLLEAENLPLGLVTAIAAPASDRILVAGEGGHAGARLMPGRRDALCAASELVLAVEQAALEAAEMEAGETEASGAGRRSMAAGSAEPLTGEFMLLDPLPGERGPDERDPAQPDTVATVGVCRVHPGAVNSIPSRVELMLDLRDTDQERRARVYSRIRSTATAIAHRRAVTITFEPINADAPATCDPAILGALEEAAQAEGLPFRRMVSRAYHDTLFMARIAPVAMLFLPCRGGVSHRPDEYASAEHMAQATRVLARTLAALSLA